MDIDNDLLKNKKEKKKKKTEILTNRIIKRTRRIQFCGCRTYKAYRI